MEVRTQGQLVRGTEEASLPGPGHGKDAPLSPVSRSIRELGRGRSATVYLDQDERGGRLARKVFGSTGFARLVQIVLLGAPNPYAWNRDAIRCAHHRRRLLARLVPLWFEGRVVVAESLFTRWNEDAGAFELGARFTPGVPPPLHHPLRMRGEGFVRELLRAVMKPLARHLEEAGFDGALWQAGYGNPVALNNFLFEGEGGVRLERPGRWVWIDLESGVPALAPLDPRTLLRFYLPRSLGLRRPLFDDVDVEKLDGWLAEHRPELEHEFGTCGFERLRRRARVLGLRQSRWKGLRRFERMIGYRLAGASIDEATAEHYATRPGRWYLREAAGVVRSLPRLLGETFARCGRFLGRVPWRRLAASAGRGLVSQRYRAFVARRFVAGRIRSWERRGQLDAGAARHLRLHLASGEASVYLTDFGVHIAIKPLVKSIQYWLLPVLWSAGFVGDGTLAVGLIAGGPIARTLYTLGRLVGSLRRGHERPFVALGVGVFPILGNLAYPLQILYSSTSEGDDLARFLLYDGCARVGRHIPIWGGADTLTEHAWNRLPDLVLKPSPDRGEGSR